MAVQLVTGDSIVYRIGMVGFGWALTSAQPAAAELTTAF